MKDGKYLGTDINGRNVWEKIPEYEFYKKEIENHGYLRCYWLGEAKQIVKYNLGALVLKGLLVVMPTIRLDDIPDTSKELN